MVSGEWEQIRHAQIARPASPLFFVGLSFALLEAPDQLNGLPVPSAQVALCAQTSALPFVDPTASSALGLMGPTVDAALSLLMTSAAAIATLLLVSLTW